MKNSSPCGLQIRSASRSGYKSKGTSFWHWMDYKQMSATRSSGWCLTVSRDPILLARPLLSSTQGDLTALLKEIKELLEELVVPVKGILSDGEETIRSAVAFVFPDVPHQLCQFHSLKDAIDPLYEADRQDIPLL